MRKNTTIFLYEIKEDYRGEHGRVSVKELPAEETDSMVFLLGTERFTSYARSMKKSGYGYVIQYLKDLWLVLPERNDSAAEFAFKEYLEKEMEKAKKAVRIINKKIGAVSAYLGKKNAASDASIEYVPVCSNCGHRFENGEIEYEQFAKFDFVACSGITPHTCPSCGSTFDCIKIEGPKKSN